MVVGIGEHAVQRIAEASGTFAIQVSEPSDLGTAIAAMILARIDLIEVASAAPERWPSSMPDERLEVSPIVAAPGGPLVLVEHCAAPMETATSIPAVVARRLVKAGLASATIDVPLLGGPLNELDRVPNAVVLRLFPVPQEGSTPSLPPNWLDAAARWVTGCADNEAPVAVRVLGVEFQVAAAEVAATVQESGYSHAWCDAVCGGFDDSVRTASLTFNPLPHLALAAAGPGADEREQRSCFDRLREIARELAADVGYACLDFEPTLEGLATGLSADGWHRQGGAPPNVVARELVDERVPDAYPYQVLGPRHLARVAALETRPLAAGRADVSLGEPPRGNREARHAPPRKRADGRSSGRCSSPATS